MSVNSTEIKDESWTRPECWTDHAELKRKCDSDTWTCVVCNEEYLSCWLCEQSGEWTFEYSENTKGWDCETCRHWFCCNCFQHTGGYRGVDYCEWRCDMCLAKK